jgi:hypothetical protein
LFLFTNPMEFSMVKMRRPESGSWSLLVMTFSTAKMQPSLPRKPIAVPLISAAFAAYSIWKTRPSGEN